MLYRYVLGNSDDLFEDTTNTWEEVTDVTTDAAFIDDPNLSVGSGLSIFYYSWDYSSIVNSAAP